MGGDTVSRLTDAARWAAWRLAVHELRSGADSSLCLCRGILYGWRPDETRGWKERNVTDSQYVRALHGKEDAFVEIVFRGKRYAVVSILALDSSLARDGVRSITAGLVESERHPGGMEEKATRDQA